MAQFKVIWVTWAAFLPFTLGLGKRGADGWLYMGCYPDDVNNRTLPYPEYGNYDTQSVESCTSYCAANKYSES